MLADGFLSILCCKIYGFLKEKETMLNISHVRKAEVLSELSSRDVATILDAEYDGILS